MMARSQRHSVSVQGPPEAEEELQGSPTACFTLALLILRPEV